jgi:hypothetical protein
MVWDTVKKRGRHPYRGFNIFIYGRQGICALERSHPRSDEEILILYRMALQLFHIDTLFFSEGGTELLHLGGETMLGVSSCERVMVGPGRRKGVIGRGCNCANALD